MSEVVDDPAGDQDTAKGLRGQLEAALKEKATLEKILNEYRAKETLTAKGFDLVKPEDLEGVKPDEIEAHAEKLQNERKQLQQELLRDALKKQGYDDDQLEEMLSGFAADKSAETEEADEIARARDLGRAKGSPVPKVDVTKLHGLEAIRAGLSKPSKP